MKTAILILMAFVCLGSCLNAQSDSVARAWPYGTVLWQTEKGIPEAGLQFSGLHQLHFAALQADSDRQWRWIWAAIALGFVLWVATVVGISKYARLHGPKLVQSKLNRDLAPMVQKGMEERFERLLRKHFQTILEVVDKYHRTESFKRDKRLLILCEDQADCTKMTTLVQDMGFAQVTARVAEDFEETEGYDLVVIAREDNDPGRYKLLDGTKIWEYLASLPNDRVVLYYGPRFERLDAEVREKIHFSNIVFTIYSRILEVFEYQFILEEKAKSMAVATSEKPLSGDAVIVGSPG